ncbi:MAG: hypothetical protein OXB84_06450 [Halobacteriovoraceae bacterium]|nr:hypothetical protein [Halobacteriovoraceae bacterium]
MMVFLPHDFLHDHHEETHETSCVICETQTNNALIKTNDFSDHRDLYSLYPALPFVKTALFSKTNIDSGIYLRAPPLWLI